jgi:hypothetical protein
MRSETYSQILVVAISSILVASAFLGCGSSPVTKPEDSDLAITETASTHEDECSDCATLAAPALAETHVSIESIGQQAYQGYLKLMSIGLSSEQAFIRSIEDVDRTLKIEKSLEKRGAKAKKRPGHADSRSKAALSALKAYKRYMELIRSGVDRQTAFLQVFMGYHILVPKPPRPDELKAK